MVVVVMKSQLEKDCGSKASMIGTRLSACSHF